MSKTKIKPKSVPKSHHPQKRVEIWECMRPNKVTAKTIHKWHIQVVMQILGAAANEALTHLEVSCEIIQLLRVRGWE